MEEDTGCIRKIPGKHPFQFAFVWMYCSLSKVSPDVPLYRGYCKFTAMFKVGGRCLPLGPFLQRKNTEESHSEQEN